MHHGTILRMAIETRTPMLVWGPPGCGKTATIHAIAAALGAHLESIIASIREPSDFGGLPVVGADKTVTLASPAWARRLIDTIKRYKILFLDEITTAPPAVQAALLRVILEGEVGDTSLPRDVAMLAAANPPEYAAGGWDLSPALANRFGHVPFDLEAGSWVTGMTAGFGAPDMDGDMSAWPLHLAAAHAEVASFIHHRPALLLQMPSEEAKQGKAWPSPRTWFMFATMRAAHKASPMASTEGLGQLCACFVGDAAAQEFYTWFSTMDLPDPEELLAHPSSWTKPNRPDIAFAALSAMTAAVMANPTPARWLAAWEVLFICADRDSMPDVAAVSAKALVAKPIAGTLIPQQAFKVFGPMLRAAGKME